MRRIRQSPVFALLLALMLMGSMALAVGAHEHLGTSDETACAGDHELVHDQPAQPATHSSGKQHDHHCAPCHLASKQAGATTLDATTSQPTVSRQGLGPRSQQGSDRDRCSPLGARGPPAA
jgi:hypothetical protein